MGSKWSGLYVLLLVLIFEGLEIIRQLLLKNKSNSYLIFRNSNFAIFFKKLAIIFVSLIILPITLYVLSYTDMFLQGKSLVCTQQQQVEGVCYFERFKWDDEILWEGYVSHFMELHRQIWWYQTNLKATHSYQSRPWQWFLDLRPVWYHVNYTQNDQSTNIYAFGNPILFWMGDIAVIFTAVLLVITSFTYLTKFKHKRDTRYEIQGNLLFILTAYLIVWLPWQLSPRIMFFYHYTPAVPLLCILLAYWLVRLTHISYLVILPSGYKVWPGRILTIFCITAIALAFILWYPHWTAWPVPKVWADLIYFALPTWK
jgi:hypothetical protein